MREICLEPSITFSVSEEMFEVFYRGKTPEEIERFQMEITVYLGGDHIPPDTKGRLRLLHAHEIVPSEQWSYGDNGNDYPVQQWVDSMDGTAEVLIIACCNTANARLRSGRSLVIYPAAAFNLYGAMYGEVQLNISFPQCHSPFGRKTIAT